MRYVKNLVKLILYYLTAKMSVYETLSLKQWQLLYKSWVFSLKTMHSV